MATKCLLSTPHPSTVPGRGLLAESRGFVDTSVEGRILFIRSVQAENKGLSRGCRYFLSNCSKDKKDLEGKRGEKRIGITIGTSIYTLYTLNCYLGRQHDSPAPRPGLPHRRARRALSLPQPGLAAVEACGVNLSAQVLTGHTEKDETFAETGHNAGTNISLR
jgi:hypothetical protein